MALDRESLAVALFERLKAALPQMKTALRRPVGWDNCPEQPAMLLVKQDEAAQAERGMPTKWTLNYDLVIYTQRTEDSQEAHDTEQNQILQAVEAALERTPMEQALAMARFMDSVDDPRTTLGGLCSHCWINGAVESDGGGMGQQGVLIVPIEILATA